MILIDYFLVLYLIRKLNKGREDNEAVKRFITYNFEEHIRKNPGQRMTIFFDMSETGLSHLVRLILITEFHQMISSSLGLRSC